MRRKILYISIGTLAAMAVEIWQWHIHSPEYLASDPIHAFDFFGLPDYNDHYIDAMYNEGYDCLSFCSAHYWYGNFNDKDKQNLEESLYELGAIKQDSSLVLKITRGSITAKATLQLNKTNNPLILSYVKL